MDFIFASTLHIIMFWWSPLSLGTGVFSYLPLSVEVGDGGDLSLSLLLVVVVVC